MPDGTKWPPPRSEPDGPSPYSRRSDTEDLGNFFNPFFWWMFWMGACGLLSRAR